MAELTYLRQLRDIHLPPKVSIWPLAWGFWLLILLLVLAFFAYHFLKPYWIAYRTKRVYLRKIEALEKNLNCQSLTDLALLLKQAALLNYPREQVASLYGEKWLEFLGKGAKNIRLEDVKVFFSEALYQPNQALDLKPAFKLAKSWLKQQRFQRCMN